MLTKEDIILLFLDDPDKLANKILYGNVPKSDEIRTLICELRNPGCAYFYAINVDKSPHPDTRQAACKDPYWKERYEGWEYSKWGKYYKYYLG